MADHPLLLPTAHSVVLVPGAHRPHPLRWVALGLGAIAILVGGLDLLVRASHLAPGCAAFNAFAPAATMFDPSLGPQAGC